VIKLHTSRISKADIHAVLIVRVKATKSYCRYESDALQHFSPKTIPMYQKPTVGFIARIDLVLEVVDR